MENVEGHAARTDSPQFKLARATLHRIIGSLSPNPFGDGPIQASVARFIDCAESAGANRANDFICAQLCPRVECHVRCGIIRDAGTRTE